MPTIGVAKSRLLGDYAPPPAERGAWSPLWDHGELVGAAVRTRRGVKPVFVSPGHRVDVASAVPRQAGVRLTRTSGRRGERGAPHARLH